MVGELSLIGSYLFYIFCFGCSSIAAKSNIKNKLLRFILIIVFPIFLATIRYNVGNDYGSYIDGFNLLVGKDFEFGRIDLIENPLFYFFEKLSALTGNDRIFLLWTSLLSFVPVVLFFENYWKKKDINWISIFFYLFTAVLFGFSAIKQGIAMAFTFYSMRYVLERKPFKFFLTVFIAFLFHSSALVFFPVYFLWNSRDNISLLKKISIISISVLVVINLNFFAGLFLEGKYEEYTGSSVYGKNLSFWLYLGITLLFILFRKKLLLLDKRNDLFIIMMILGVILLIIGFTNAFTKRIAEYFLYVQVILFPQLINCFREQDKPIVTIALIVYIVLLFTVAYPYSPDAELSFIPFRFKL
ncbi:MAG: EpsG family protein [Clostridia bacterium]|nr:EpsG family protein [Clostridia bacterium]